MIALYGDDSIVYATVGDPVPANYLENVTAQGFRAVEFSEPLSLPLWCYHVVDGVLQERPSLNYPSIVEIKADGSDVATLSGIPAGATVTVDGSVVEVEGNELALASDMPAEYDIRIEAMPFLPHELKVIAHAVAA